MMRRPASVLASVLATLTLALGITACGGGDSGGPSAQEPGGLDLGPVASEPVAYSQVQEIFTTKCSGCHPVVNSALDLTPGRSYEEIVGVPAVEAPGLVRVVAGDPAASFLYLKVVGFPGLGDVPAVGTRMPPMAPRLPDEEIRVLRDWIAQGAKNENGQTVSKNAVPVRGAQPTFTGAPQATREEGTGTLVGRVTDQRGRPITGAIVTLLLKGSSFPDGEEHVRAALTGPDGRYRMPNVPVARIELKAYAPNTIYVSRVLEVTEGGSSTADFGLPDRKIRNPEISKPEVTSTAGSTRLALTLAGRSLDRNYTVAVNVGTLRVFELRAITDAQGATQPGEWTRELAGSFTGDWIFLAVDETCNVSEFLRVRSSS